jgi:hypothetical protein
LTEKAPTLEQDEVDPRMLSLAVNEAGVSSEPIVRGRPPRPNLQVLGGRKPRDMKVIHGIAHKMMCPLVECGAAPAEWCRVRFGQGHHLERYYVLRDARMISPSEFDAVLAIPHRLGDNSFALIPVDSLD